MASPMKLTADEVFAMMDSNQNGFITREEFERAIAQHSQGIVVDAPVVNAPVVDAPNISAQTTTAAGAAGAVRASPQEIFTLMDKNKDGHITRQEFDDTLSHFKQGIVVTGTPYYFDEPNTLQHSSGATAETEIDGKVQLAVGDVLEGIDPSPEELYIYRDLDGELTGAGGEVFAMIDANADGVITKEEFMNAFAGNKRIGLTSDFDMYGDGGQYAFPGMPGMPGFDVNVPGMPGFDVNLNAPDINLHGMDVNLKVPDVYLHGPDVDLSNVRLDFQGMNVDVDMPNIDMPDINIEGPNIDIEGPDIKGPDVELPDFSCFQKFLLRCEMGCDLCEHLCCIPCLFQCAVCCGFNIKDRDRDNTSYLFSLLCFILFALPITITYQLSQDMQVRYWISDRLSLVLILPVAYLIAQWWHAKKCALSRFVVCTCLIGSCIVLLFLGDMVLLSAYRTSNVLLSDDCTTDLEKQKLQIQWNNAALFYSDCMEQTVKTTGSSLQASYGLYRVQDCAGYSEHLDANPAWPYLGALEEAYQCGGWCTRAQPLWTFKSVKDSCSTTVSDVLVKKVQWNMRTVIVYTVVVLLFVSVVLIQAGPILRSHGVVWK